MIFGLRKSTGFYMNTKTHTVDLARIDGTDEYFISGEGHHRITLWKLSDLNFKTLPVSIAIPILRDSN
jgi:hypothetical protein